jgi:hypothetical protein
MNEASGGVLGMAAGFVSVGAAVAGARALLVDFNQEFKDAANTLRTVEDANKRLAQLSGGSSPKYAALKAAGDMLALDAGVPMAAGRLAQFDLVSANLAKDFPKWSGASKVTDLPALIPIIGKSRAQFGKDMPGADIINMLLTASGTSLEDLGGIGEMSVRPSVAMKNLGGNMPELLAILSQYAWESESKMEGSTQTGRALRKLSGGIPITGMSAESHAAAKRLSGAQGELVGIEARERAIDDARRRFDRDNRDRRLGGTLSTNDRAAINTQRDAWEDEEVRLSRRADALRDTIPGLRAGALPSTRTVNLGGGKGAIAAVQHLAELRKQHPEQVAKWLGGDAFTERVVGFIGKNVPGLRALQGQIAESAGARGETSALGQAIGVRMRDPEDAALIRSGQMATAKEILKARKYGIAGLDKESALDAMEAQVDKSGLSWLRKKSVMTDARMSLFFQPGNVKKAVAGFEQASGLKFDTGALLDEMREQTKLLQRQAEAAERREKLVPASAPNPNAGDER